MKKLFAIAFLLVVPVRYAIEVRRKRVPTPSQVVSAVMIALVSCAIILLLIGPVGDFDH